MTTPTRGRSPSTTGSFARPFESHDGKEEGTQGDSFFATFTSPSACVAAVVQMQLGLAEFEWPGGEQLRVRMGVHSGEVSGGRDRPRRL